MAGFIPAEQKAILQGDCGIDLYLGLEFEEARAERALAHAAANLVDMAVRCMLVGLTSPARQLLEKGKHWVQVAIDEGERPAGYAADTAEARCYETLAYCTWLLDARHDAESLRSYTVHARAYLMKRRNKVETSLNLPVFIDAEAYVNVQELAESVGVTPKSLKAVRGEGAMCYVLAQHKLDRTYTADQVKDALRVFLDLNTGEWLGRGHYVRAAVWMKIAYWNGDRARLSPAEVLLKCYDHLPGM